MTGRWRMRPHDAFILVLMAVWQSSEEHGHAGSSSFGDPARFEIYSQHRVESKRIAERAHQSEIREQLRALIDQGNALSRICEDTSAPLPTEGVRSWEAAAVPSRIVWKFGSVTSP